MWKYCCLLLALFFGAGGANIKKYYAEDLCLQNGVHHLYMNNGRCVLLTSTSDGRSGRSCEIVLKPSQGTTLILSIRSYNLSSRAQLTIQDSDFHHELRGRKEFLYEKKFVSSEDRISIRFKSPLHSPRGKVNFELVATQTYERPCVRGDFECGNGQCIDADLQCDGYYNCGDRSDERQCGNWNVDSVHHAKTSFNVWYITFVVVASLLLIIIIVVLVVVIRHINSKKKEPDTVPTASVPPAEPQPSYWTQFRNSLRSASRPMPKEQQMSDSYEVPSMYPPIAGPTAPEMEGIENSEFQAEE